VTAGSAPAFSASFGSNNRMVGYSYDNNGNQLTTPDGATLEYDPDNRLTKWTKQGQVEQYQYHPSGWRLSKGSEKYLYGPGGQLLESYRAWNDMTDYVYFGGRLLYTLSAGQAVTRIYSDRLGSTRATDTIEPFGGGWTTRNYYPFGEEVTAPQGGDQYKFASTYRDSATGLDYAVNRYYASGMGRFLTVDPKGSARGRSPGTWNRYTYGGNDPISRADPLGLDSYLIGDDDPDIIVYTTPDPAPCGPDWIWNAALRGPCTDIIIDIGIIAGSTSSAPALPMPAYLKVTEDCYQRSVAPLGEIWERHVTYTLFGDNGQPLSYMRRAVIYEHLEEVAGLKPQESASKPGDPFFDEISVRETGDFIAKQTFSVSVGGREYEDFAIQRSLPGPPSFNMIRAEPKDIWINGYKNTDMQGGRKQCGK
jgi:RHS repeat-associated protein